MAIEKIDSRVASEVEHPSPISSALQVCGHPTSDDRTAKQRRRGQPEKAKEPLEKEPTEDESPVNATKHRIDSLA